MAEHVALLRGINIGPYRRIAMGDLRELLTAQGYANVRTHLQSGNVLLRSDADPQQLALALEAQLATHFGFAVPIVVRSREELADVIARNPLGPTAADPKRHQVSFLTGEPPAELAAAIRAAALAPEAVAISGREIFAWHPEGIIRSPLAKLLSSPKLGATARNWNTVTALLDLAND